MIGNTLKMGRLNVRSGIGGCWRAGASVAVSSDVMLRVVSTHLAERPMEVAIVWWSRAMRIGCQLSKISKYCCLLISASLTGFTMMRTVFLSIAGILLHLDAAGRSVFKKRDDFEPTGRFWTSLFTVAYLKIYLL